MAKFILYHFIRALSIGWDYLVGDILVIRFILANKWKWKWKQWRRDAKQPCNEWFIHQRTVCNFPVSNMIRTPQIQKSLEAKSGKIESKRKSNKSTTYVTRQYRQRKKVKTPSKGPWVRLLKLLHCCVQSPAHPLSQTSSSVALPC